MTWAADAGRTLLVKDEAAEKVGKSLDELATKLEAIQQKFQGTKANLGMNGSTEGDTWNGKVDEALLAVYNKIGEFIDRANALAANAHAMQKQCHEVDDGVANQFDGLDRSAGYPKPA